MNDPNREIRWDDPNDSAVTWSGGRDFVLPLQQSLSLYYYQGWAKAFRAIDVTGGLRARFVNGYEYRLWAWRPRQSFGRTEALARQRERDVPQLWAQEWLPSIQADLAQWQQIILPDLTNDELARHLHRMLTRQLEHWAIHAVMGDAPLSAVGRLVDWYLQRFPDAPESEPYRLVQGQPNTSTEANRQLWHLSQLAKQGQLVERLAIDFDDPLALPAEFQAAFTEYCQRFGVTTPEQQQRALLLISSYGGQELPDPYAELQRLAAERDNFIEAVRANLTAAECRHFDDLLTCALANNPLTESHNLYLDQMSDAATKRVIGEFARRLLTQGILTERTEIDYLSVYELLQWGQGLANPLRPIIQARQQEYAHYHQLTPPLFIGLPPATTGAERVDRFSGPTAPQAHNAPDLIGGIGASPGIARGRALVTQTLATAVTLQVGEILVCRTTDPTWTPLFAIAGGLVTDFGGSLSHAAVVAREYRLPAVVGTHVATYQIVSGQWLEVDGTQGVVRLLPPD